MQQNLSLRRDFKGLVKDAWLSVAVVSAIFIAHGAITGIAPGGGPVGAIIGATIVGRQALIKRWPYHSNWQRRSLLAGSALAGALVALAVSDLLHYLHWVP